MPKIPLSVIEEIKYRSDIEDVISRYLTLKRVGSNFTALCPFHSERTPSFTVFPSTQNFYCFGCGVGGDVISFIMRIENLDYISALRYLAERAGVTIPEEIGSNGGETVSRQRILDMNRDAARFYRDSLFNGKYGDAGMKYLLQRGVPPPIIKRFGLGFAPDSFDAMSSHMHSLGYTDTELAAGFLRGVSRNTGKHFDMFRGRVMFPIIDTQNRVIAFGGRAIGNAEPKYLNSSDTAVFKKSRNLFALNFARRHCAEELILCEGYMDVIALHAAGFENAIATLGTALTPEQARLMKKYTKRVIINYDSDDAGQRAANRAIEILNEVGLEVRILRLSGAKDPDEYIKKYGADKFRLALSGSRTKFDFFMDKVTSRYNLDNAEDKISALKEITDYISNVRSEAEREIYIAMAAKTVGISETSIKNDVLFIINKKRKEKKKKEVELVHRTAAGYGDRINLDKIKELRAASCEEALLGMMMAFPEYIGKEPAGVGRILPDDFLTTFGRRAYEAITQVYEENGSFDIGALSDKFTQDEISRLVKLTLDRQNLRNDDEVFAEYAAALKREAQERRIAEEDPLEYVKRLREKNKKSI